MTLRFVGLFVCPDININVRPRVHIPCSATFFPLSLCTLSNPIACWELN